MVICNRTLILHYFSPFLFSWPTFTHPFYSSPFSSSHPTPPFSRLLLPPPLMSAGEAAAAASLPPYFLLLPIQHHTTHTHTHTLFSVSFLLLLPSLLRKSPARAGRGRRRRRTARKSSLRSFFYLLSCVGVCVCGKKERMKRWVCGGRRPSILRRISGSI